MIANVHARAIKQIDEAVLVGAADLAKECADVFCDKYGIFAFSDYDELLSFEGVDTVSICTPQSAQFVITL